MHGNGRAFAEMRDRAIEKKKTPALLDGSQGEEAIKAEVDYLNGFLDEHQEFMASKPDHRDGIDRIHTEQHVLLNNGDLNLELPL